MANRGLSNEEIAYVKAMIELGMKRDVIHSFFVEPGRPITPAFVSEIDQGKIGPNVKPASKDEVAAFINHKSGHRRVVFRRTKNQLDLFGDDPPTVPAPHQFQFDDKRLIEQTFENYAARSDADAQTYLEEARHELARLVDDPALGNHPRIKTRIEELAEQLSADIANINPVLAGARAKKIMECIHLSIQEFSGDFVGEISAATGSVIMFCTCFEGFRGSEIKAQSMADALQEFRSEHIHEIAASLRRFPVDVVEPKIPNHLVDLVSEAESDLGSEQIITSDQSILGILKASLSYASLSTISQLAAALVRALKEGLNFAYESVKNIYAKIKTGTEAITVATTAVSTSAAILYFLVTPIRKLATDYPSILGWTLPYLELIEKLLS